MDETFETIIDFHRARPATLFVYVLSAVAYPVGLIGVPAVAGQLLEQVKQWAPLSAMKRPILLILLLASITMTMDIVRSITDLHNSIDFKVHVRVMMMRRIMRSRAYRFRAIDIPSTVTQLNQIPVALFWTAKRFSASVIPGAGTMLGMSVYFVWLSAKARDPWIGGVAIGVTVVVAAMMVLSVRYSLPELQDTAVSAELLYDRGGDVLEVLRHTLVVDAREEEIARSADAIREHVRLHRRANVRATLLENGAQIITILGIVMIAVLGWRALRDKRIDPGTFTGVIFVIMCTRSLLYQLSSSINLMVSELSQASRLGDLLRQLDADSAHANAAARDALPPIDAPVCPNGGAITFDGVTFQYPPPATAPVLTNVSFALPAGASVLVTGAVGSGKSTISALLLSLQQPTSGTVTVCGHDVATLGRTSIRRLVTEIPAVPLLLKRTVRENMLYGMQDHALTDTDLRRALARVVLTTLPLSRRVGKHGALLSTGQRKLVFLAKALLLDTPVIVADELTANLDPAASAAVVAALNATVAASKTLIFISHAPPPGVSFTHHLRVAGRGITVESTS